MSTPPWEVVFAVASHRQDVQKNERGKGLDENLHNKAYIKKTISI